MNHIFNMLTEILIYVRIKNFTKTIYHLWRYCVIC